MITFPAVPEGEPLRVSASAFVSYQTCAFQAGARYEGRFGPDSLPAFRGGLAHQVFARHLRTGPIPSEEFEQACREEIGAKHLNLKISSLGLKPSSIKAVIAEVGALYDRFKAFPVEGFRGAEVSIEIEVTTGVTLVGSIDAVFEGPDTVRLVDWKTGGLGEPLTQLRFYALLWFLQEGELPDVVEAFSVKTGEQLAELPTRTNVQVVADEVAAMVSAVRRSWDGGPELVRRAGPWCQSCAVLEECPEGRSSVSLLSPTSSASPPRFG